MGKFDCDPLCELGGLGIEGMGSRADEDGVLAPVELDLDVVESPRFVFRQGRHARRVGVEGKTPDSRPEANSHVEKVVKSLLNPQKNA